MEKNNYKGGFRDLEVWKESRQFRTEISKLCKGLSETEKFRLVDQLLRASRSITANIAEGYGRFHYQENIQFCRQARGSLMECLDHLTCALDENYIDQESFNNFDQQYEKIIKLINGYISYLKRKKQVDLDSAQKKS
jgi:four helix bundle protein